MDKDLEIDALIAKYLSGECTLDEMSHIDCWKESSPDNELIFKQSEDAWRLTDNHLADIHFNKKRTWANIQRNIRREYSLATLLRTAGIAASVALILGWVIPYIFTGNRHDNFQNPQIITLHIPAGVSSHTVLPDSTVVWLNASSTIRYPSFFDGDSRTVELIGEGFFDVTHDKDKPFIIKSGNISVNVLGTSFDFKNYEEDTHAVLAVETGVVSLSTDANTIMLQAGKYATVDNQTLQTTVFDAPYYSVWRDNRLVFREESFSDVLNELARKYNVDFAIQSDEIRHYIYTATFNNLNLEDILKLLKMSSPIDYQILNQPLNKKNAYDKKKIIIYKK